MSPKLFKEILNDHNHKLYKLLPSTSFSEYNLRKESTVNIPTSKTNRFKNSFIISICMKCDHFNFYD